MNVLTALPWRKPLAHRPLRPAPEGTAARDDEAGCGWFESSHDLASGLFVREYARAADLPGDALPLADWLALQTPGWPAALAS